MKILRIAQNLYPEVPGGGSYHVHAMSRDQAEMGHDVTVLTVTDDDSLPRREERDEYTVVRRKPTVELLGNEISAGVAKFLAQADEYDVVHAHSHLYFSTNLAAVKRRLGDTPLAITNHGLYSQTATEWMFDAYLKTLGRWTFNSADVVFCYTETDKQRVQDLGVSSRIEVVQNGIDTRRFTPDGPKSKSIESDGPVVLFVGRLVEGKRPGLAIEAFAQVVSEYPDAELYFIGDGPLREQLDQKISNFDIGDAVTFLGHVSYDEMPNVYRSGDVLVLPSRAEGLPRTVLEAMASGVAVVVNDLDQMTGIIGNGGHIVDMDDRQATIEAISSCLSRQDSTATGNEGRESVVNHHRWSETVEGTTKVLASLVDGNP